MKKQDLEQDVLTAARERVLVMYERFDHIAVMFSGGKDSTVVMQLCLEESRRRGQQLDVVFLDEESIHPDTIDYVRRVGQMDGVALRWICWPLMHRNACSRKQPFWIPWNPADREKWVREPPPEGDFNAPAEWAANPKYAQDLHGYLFPPSMGNVGIALGIRAQESLRRYRSVTFRENQEFSENWISNDPCRLGLFKCKPVYDWVTEDVWTAPARLGWDYNHAYDRMAAFGLSPSQQRVGPPFGEEPLQNLVMYATLWPELWERMANRVPGARTAARYCRSPLYGHGSRVSGPSEGDSWEAMVRTELMKWPAKERQQIAARIKQEIATHNRRTGNAPIADRMTPGVLSWQFLYQVARRGDLKKRKGIDKKPKEPTP